VDFTDMKVNFLDSICELVWKQCSS